MKTADVLKLIDAGFTAEQILKMDSPEEPEKKQEDPKQEKKQEDPKQEKKQEDPKQEQPPLDPDVKKVIDQALKSMEEVMDKNMKSMAEAFRLQLQPSKGEVKPLGIEDVITNFFK